MLCLPAFAKRYKEANIVGLDEERIEVVDYLLDKFFDLYILFDDRAFQDALSVLNTVLKVVRELQEYPLLIAVAKAFATLL